MSIVGRNCKAKIDGEQVIARVITDPVPASLGRHVYFYITVEYNLEVYKLSASAIRLEPAVTYSMPVVFPPQLYRKVV